MWIRAWAGWLRWWGGGGGGVNNTLDVTVNPAALQGSLVATEPTLTVATAVPNGGTVDVDSSNSGTAALGGAQTTINFTAPSDIPTLMVYLNVAPPADSADINVVSCNGSPVAASVGAGNTKVLFIDNLVTGDACSIKFSAYGVSDPSASFTLKLTEPNRQTLGMEEGDYLVRFIDSWDSAIEWRNYSADGSLTSSSNSNSPGRTEGYNAIVNFGQGRVTDLDGNEFRFTAADKRAGTFTYKSSYHFESDDGVEEFASDKKRSYSIYVDGDAATLTGDMSGHYESRTRTIADGSYETYREDYENGGVTGTILY